MDEEFIDVIIEGNVIIKTIIINERVVIKMVVDGNFIVIKIRVIEIKVIRIKVIKIKVIMRIVDIEVAVNIEITEALNISGMASYVRV